MEKLKIIFQWLVYSSSNPSRIALTLKAGIPFLVLFGISDTETLHELVGSIGSFIASLAQTITFAITIYGLVRKLWFTYKEK